MSANGPIADGSQRAICTYGANALDLNIYISAVIGVKQDITDCSESSP